MSLLALVTLVAVGIDWIIAAMLAYAAWVPPRVPALTVQALTTLAIAIGSSAALWVMDAGARGALSADSGRVIGLLIVCLVSVPALVWAWHYLRGDFR